METVRFDGVSFSYPLAEKKALDHISLSIEASDFVVLCGRSGCGKSTLLRHLKKNLTPYGRGEGSVTFHGMEISELDDRVNASKIGFVQQNPDNQIVTDKVWHELAFGLENLGMENGEIRRRVAEMASFFGIQTWFRRSVTELSGGQKQLLNLASIMVMQPELLVLDEPTSQLDPIAASEFIRTLYRINRELGTTVIISEHRLEELFPIADKVIVMEQAKISCYDRPENVGRYLAAEKHPMFYGIPSVMKIFADLDGKGSYPLTIREGRVWLSNLLNGKEAKDVLERNHPEHIKDYAIEAKDLHFKYARGADEVLSGCSLKVERGRWHCLLGGNGVGKSTLLKAITGIIKPQDGSILVDGINTKKAGRELFDKRLAMVPQNPQALFTEITVQEELLEALSGQKLSDSEKVERIQHMIELMQLSGYEKVHPYDLSGGEQQRLALGKILLLEPKILLLDEPTKGLDPFFKRTLAGIFRRITEEGITIFMVSHDIEFCAEYADYCSMFFDGTVVDEDYAREFFAGNSFYTTIANRMARKWFPGAVTCEEVAACVKASM